MLKRAFFRAFLSKMENNYLKNQKVIYKLLVHLKALFCKNLALEYHKITPQHAGGTYATPYSQFIRQIRITQTVIAIVLFVGGVIFSFPKLHQTIAATSVNFSGVAYTDEGTSPLDGTAVNKTVYLSVNGVYTGTDEITDNTGAWAINSVSVDSGDIITVYLDNETEEATTVFVSNETTQSNINLYQNFVIVRADTGSISNANLDTGDDTDDDIKYSVDISDNVTFDSGFHLHIWAGDTYAPAGTVATQGGGDIHITSSATFNTGGNAVTVNGSWDNDGAYVHGNGLVTFNASSGTHTIDADSPSDDDFYNVVINDGGGTAHWDLTSQPMQIDGNLTITDGEIDLNNYDTYVEGDLSKTGGALVLDQVSSQ
ncbi:hypothetical protein KJ733_04805, partial [Patescibacteria group bacterium]|nr:hypothetical protein [Patescibacteria group bacterium]